MRGADIDGLSGFSVCKDTEIRATIREAAKDWRTIRNYRERQAARFLDEAATDWEIRVREERRDQ